MPKNKQQALPGGQPTAARENKRGSSGALLWGASGALTVVAVGLFIASGVIASNNEADLLERGKVVTAAQKRVDLATSETETVPSAEDARSWLAAATTSAATVEEIQNEYRSLKGAVSLEGVPLGEKLPFGEIKPFSVEHRTELAEGMRDVALEELQRSALSFFDEADTDEKGDNAAGSWLAELGLEDRASQLSWSSPEVRWFDESRTSQVFWQLRDGKGSLVAWASATWSEESRTMGDFALSLAATQEGGKR